MSKNKMRQVKVCLNLLCERLAVDSISVKGNGGLRIQGKPTRRGLIPSNLFINRWPGAKAGLFRITNLSRKDRALEVQAMKVKGEFYKPIWFGQHVNKFRSELEQDSATQEALKTKRKEN